MIAQLIVHHHVSTFAYTEGFCEIWGLIELIDLGLEDKQNHKKV